MAWILVIELNWIEKVFLFKLDSDLTGRIAQLVTKHGRIKGSQDIEIHDVKSLIQNYSINMTKEVLYIICGYFAVVLFSRISRVRSRGNFHFKLCPFNSNENIRKIMKIMVYTVLEDKSHNHKHLSKTSQSTPPPPTDPVPCGITTILSRPMRTNTMRAFKAQLKLYFSFNMIRQPWLLIYMNLHLDTKFEMHANAKIILKHSIRNK